MAAILPLLFGVALVGCSQTDAKLPVYWEAPEFTLLNQLGDTVVTADLRGTPWVASFVFTSCTDVCPLITRRMAVLRDTPLPGYLAPGSGWFRSRSILRGHA